MGASHAAADAADLAPQEQADELGLCTADEARSARTATGIALVTATLTALGIVLVYSSTSVGVAAADQTLFLRRQLLWVCLGAGVFALARTANLNALRRAALPLLVVSALLLLLVLVPGVGRRVNGARRWIRIGPFNGQPSELAKLALVVFTAAWAASRREQLATLRGASPILAIIAGVCALIAVEPDMGTALLAGGVSLSLLLVAGMRLRHLLLVGLPCALVAAGFALTRLDYIQRRIEAFLDPGADPSGVAYQTRQALIALGSGGTTGVGLGASQQKLLFLPDVHTDFIFALVGEELGFLGATFVLLCFAALALYGLRAADRARDGFAFLLAVGIALTLGVQSLLNVAVATASVPPKGIALPFVSFGGSSLLAAAAMAGLLARVAAEGRDAGPLLPEAEAGPRWPAQAEVAR